MRKLVMLSVTCACLLSVACDSGDSTTELNPEGPPMIRQVFMFERVEVPQGDTSVFRLRDELAFGDHPEIGEEDDRQMLNAIPKGAQQRIRIVVDELLLGNFIEEVACADGSWSTIPVDADPDDISDCAGPDLSKCTAVCVGADGPIGIRDEIPSNPDGAPDDFRMIDYGGELAVSVECGGVTIPIDREQSFYQPSGNQKIPASSGFDGLGPALFLKSTGGYRSGAACSLSFRPEVVDKEGLSVCAPPNGDINQACTPGDTSAVSFNIEPLRVTGNSPRDDSTVAPSATSGDFTGRFMFNMDIDENSLAGITFERTGTGAGPVTFTPEISADDLTLLTITVAGGLAPNATYTLTLGTSLQDVFGGQLPEAFVVNFSTDGGGTPMVDASVDAAADAGTPDAM